MSDNQLIMRISITISLLALVKGEAVECGGPKALVRGRCYEEEVLVNNIYRARNLIVDWHTNVLYFIDWDSYNQTARYLDLDTNELGVITQVSDASAYAVDQGRHEVYVAGKEKIYKLHHTNKTVERLWPISRYYVLSMFYRNGLFYTNGRLYTLKNGESVEVEDMKGKMALNYVVDEDGYQYFRDHDALYGKMNGSETVDGYEGRLYPAAVALDTRGMPYSCEHRSLYFVNKEKKALDTIGNLYTNCLDIAFDKDNNMIYSTYDKIIKLKAAS